MTRRNRDNPFEDVFEQMNKAIQNMQEEMERMMQGVEQNGADFRGYAFTKLPGQEPQVTKWGDNEVGDTPGTGGKTTHIDVMEEENQIHVVADMPGVSKEDIELKIEGNILTVKAENEDRSYHERVNLPGGVDPDSADASYNNGVIQITLEKQDDGRSIEID